MVLICQTLSILLNSFLALQDELAFHSSEINFICLDHLRFNPIPTYFHLSISFQRYPHPSFLLGASVSGLSSPTSDLSRAFTSLYCSLGMVMHSLYLSFLTVHIPDPFDCICQIALKSAYSSLGLLDVGIHTSQLGMFFKPDMSKSELILLFQNSSSELFPAIPVTAWYPQTQ